MDFNISAAPLISYPSGDRRNFCNVCSLTSVYSLSGYKRQQITIVSLKIILSPDQFTCFWWHWFEERQSISHFPTIFQVFYILGQYINVGKHFYNVGPAMCRKCFSRVVIEFWKMEVLFCQNELIYLKVSSLWYSVHFSHMTRKTAMWWQANVQEMNFSPTVAVSPANRKMGWMVSQHSHSNRKIRGYLRPWWSQYNLQNAKKGISSSNLISNFNPKIFLQVNCLVHINLLAPELFFNFGTLCI